MIYRYPLTLHPVLSFVNLTVSICSAMPFEISVTNEVDIRQHVERATRFLATDTMVQELVNRVLRFDEGRITLQTEWGEDERPSRIYALEYHASPTMKVGSMRAFRMSMKPSDIVTNLDTYILNMRNYMKASMSSQPARKSRVYIPEQRVSSTINNITEMIRLFISDFSYECVFEFTWIAETFGKQPIAANGSPV